MKGIVVTPEGNTEVKDFAEPLYQTVGAAVGGYMEIVHPVGLPEPFCMVICEDGRLQKLPFNPIASYWYGTQKHGQPIVGTVVLMKTGLDDDGEMDILGLTDFEVAPLNRLIDSAKESPDLPKDPGDVPVRYTVISW